MPVKVNYCPFCGKRIKFHIRHLYYGMIHYCSNCKTFFITSRFVDINKVVKGIRRVYVDSDKVISKEEFVKMIKDL